MDLITGTSSGLGYGLGKYLLGQGHRVAGLSRRPSTLEQEFPEHYFHFQCDLGDLKELPARLRQYYQLLREWNADKTPDSKSSSPRISLNRVWLNAGVLGRIDDLQNTTLQELQRVTDINLWSNKVIIDSLASPDCPCDIEHIVAISSGASVNGNRGWAGYSISKAALNMLIKLYSEELPEIHFLSLAPGLIDTDMQETISGIEDTDTYPALKRLQQARGTESMPMPVEAARIILSKWAILESSPSGSFLDIRKI
ncbi:MAG: alcohol dehydrogenase [Leptospiraceae bacterium]|nr:alcohol dehydrogenase [Leptospiraceae bacterium]